MKHIFNWILWCIKLKEILPWKAGYVSHRKLTKDEYYYSKEIK